MDVDFSIELNQALRGLAQSKKAGERAEKRTITKVTKWAKGELIKDVAKRSNIPQKILKGSKGRKGSRSHHSVHAVQGGHVGRVWLGKHPVKAAYVGKPRQLRKGAKAGRHSFDGAFVAKMSTGHIGIYKRQGKKRTPILEQYVSLETADYAVKVIEAKIPERLETVLKQEMNYEFNVKGLS